MTGAKRKPAEPHTLNMRRIMEQLAEVLPSKKKSRGHDLPGLRMALACVHECLAEAGFANIALVACRGSARDTRGKVLWRSEQCALRVNEALWRHSGRFTVRQLERQTQDMIQGSGMVVDLEWVTPEAALVDRVGPDVHLRIQNIVLMETSLVQRHFLEDTTDIAAMACSARRL